jgi:hypothetical protein
MAKGVVEALHFLHSSIASHNPVCLNLCKFDIRKCIVDWRSTGECLG